VTLPLPREKEFLASECREKEGERGEGNLLILEVALLNRCRPAPQDVLEEKEGNAPIFREDL